MKKPQKVNLTSSNLSVERQAELERIIPEAFVENKIDWEKLKAVLGGKIDERMEKFNFTWAGKSNAIKNVLMPSKLTLKPLKNESVKWDESENLFIEGDNLEVLKLLQKAYFEKVKMIYIDPPYNTGGDFVYRDDFASPLNNYLEQTGQKGDGMSLSTNRETNGRYHSDWLSMIYPRLKLAWNLLKEDGVIFVSIDDNEAHHLRMVMDEIFGEENFIADIAVVNNLKGRNDKRYIATANERLLMYVKSDAFEESGLKMPEERFEEFNLEDKIGKYRLLGLRKRGGADTRGQRPKMFFPIFVNKKTGEVSIEKNTNFDIEVLPRKSDNSDGCWRWGLSTVKSRVSSLVGRAVGNKGKYDIFEKDYLETEGEIRRIKPKSVMFGANYSTDGATKSFRALFPEVHFNNPKSVAFIRDLISYSSSEDEDVVLDFFAGSGTTAHAILEQNQEDKVNRKFILVQLPEAIDKESETYRAGYKTIAGITKERIRRVIKGYGDKPEPIDAGFKVFKLDKSNYTENNFELDSEKSEEENVLAFKDYLEKTKEQGLFEKVNDLDVVFENIVKEGLSLNSKIVKKKLGENEIYQVVNGEQSLLICLDKQIAAATIKLLTGESYKDKIFICLDNALDDSSKANLVLNLELKTI